MHWRDNLHFDDILSVVPTNTIVAMYYPYHEASEDKFANFVLARLKERPFSSALARLRKMAGLSQSDLARMTCINIRNIQQYEQGANDIRKASFDKIEFRRIIIADRTECDPCHWEFLDCLREKSLLPVTGIIHQVKRRLPGLSNKAFEWFEIAASRMTAFLT